MSVRISRAHQAILMAGAGTMAVLLGGSPVQAQTIFCPTTIAGQGGTFALQNGQCTNGGIGAFSNAALASQALSDLAQSTTQQTSEISRTSLDARRQTEQDRCPDGFERLNGMCRRIATAEPPPAPPPPPAVEAPAPRTERPRPGRRVAAPPPPRVAVRPAPILKAPPPPVETPVRYASWLQGYGDYERRTGTSSFTAPPIGVGVNTNLILTGESKATTGGFLGGLDMTVRSFSSAADGFVFGVMAGYTNTNVRLTTTSTPTPLVPGQASGTSLLKVRLEGGSAGAYGIYFNGPFSADLTFRADFLSLHESFTDVLAFNAGGVTTSTFSGTGSTDLVNLTLTGNLNYRFLLGGGSWIEPTAGFQYTTSDYETSAAALGLSDGHLLRLQAGLRYGVDYFWNGKRLTTTITGLVYDNVNVTGGFIQNVAFGNGALIVNDEGKLRGQGILAFNLDYGNGVSLFAQGDVRGGEGLFGVGGKGGVRWQW
jgi:hypothetical protein